MSTFVWTQHGKAVHVTDDSPSMVGGINARTRCGRWAMRVADADAVAWYWPPCSKCVDLNGMSGP